MANNYFAADSSEFAGIHGGSNGSGTDSGGAVTIVNWWEMALLAAGPVTAFLYALAAALFLPGWGECSLTDVFPSLMPRNSLLIFAVAFAIHRSKNEPEEQGFRLLVAVCISIAASWYLILQTRLHQIEGGPGPNAAVVTAADKAEQLKCCEGKVVVISGANAGIGKETARQLYWSGAATVVLACRSLERAAAARDDIMSTPPAGGGDSIPVSGTDATDENTPLQAKPAGKVEIQALDLSSLKSVRQAAKELLKKYKTIDVLINNAGIMMDQQSVTDDGYDLTMQANYLGHYLWTRLLLPALHKSQDPRIINVTSSTYTLATNIDLEDLFCQKGVRQYTLFGQYAQSKLAQILFTNELNVRYGGDDRETDSSDSNNKSAKNNKNSKNIWTASVHPGLVRTEVVRNLPFWMKAGNATFSWVLRSLQKTPEQGAWCSVLVATAAKDDLPVSGAYWVNRRTQETLDCANSVDDAKALWEMSAKLVGLEK
jgi:retinol dehydrogenase-12